MKFYHGSRSKFDSFSIPGDGKHGVGFYFTQDKSEAQHFARSLYGNGTDNTPTVYTVNLRVSNPFNTMDNDHCEQVMNHIGQTFKPNKNAGGAKEQYYYLARQLKAWGYNDVNQAIKSAGFDAVFWEFMNHMIVFDPQQIEILDAEPLD
jgi:hypothetical protein